MSKMPGAQAKTVAPYGTWDSPISTDSLAQKRISFGDLIVVPANDDKPDDQPELIFVENRPQERGRAALVHTTGGGSIDGARDLTAGNHNARSGVHEYGGGAAARLADGSFLFTDYNPKSFDVLRTSLDTQPHVVTPENAAHRFADFGSHPTDPNLALAILEDHTIDEPSKVINSLVCIDLSTTPATIHTLRAGRQGSRDATTKPDDGSDRDFYTFPRFSPNGRYVAWISWLHPSMPWWGTELWIAHFHRDGDGAPTLSHAQSVRVGPQGKDEALQQPVWAIPRDPLQKSSDLLFTSDATNFSNLYSVHVDGGEGDEAQQRLSVSEPKAILPEPVKRDFSPPCWTLNNSSFVPLTPDLLVVTLTKGAKDAIGLINLRKPRVIQLDSPFVAVSQLRRLTATSFALVVTRDDEPSTLVTVDLRGLAASGYKVTDSNIRVIKRSSDIVFDGTISKDLLSVGEEIEFPTELPDGTPSTSHAVIFPPKNPRYTAPAGTSPPCIFTIHGGPTSSAHSGLALANQFWTSRGWMVCSVNYGGSTGYGRDFMDRLSGQWGVVDVQDCISAAEYLGSPASGSSKRFSELSAAEADAVRRQLKQARRDRASLTETKTSNGSTQVTLRNTASTWSWIDLLVAAGVATSFATSLISPLGRQVAAGGALVWLWNKLRRVDSQTLTVIPSVGLQISTTRGLSLPFAPSLRLFTTKSSRLIPRDRILDVYVGEGFRRWSVIDYLALVEKDGRRDDVEKPGTRAGKVVDLFSELSPRLSVVEKVYRTIYPALFGQQGKGLAESSSSSSKGRKKRLPLADPNAIVISGGSAGGYTVLLSLCLSRIFSSGTSRYGVGDLKLLAADSHKFESQYPFKLIGGTPDEVPDVYRDRSPIYLADRIEAPLLVQQGTEDKVVPPNQSEVIVDSIRKRGGRVEYLLFQGEGHGFRSADNQKKSLQAELDWYNDVLHLSPTQGQ
ncbi:uncharacterized protein PFL1_05801 [Pseudozyma flocculosa PF-1]|uniref:Uncharacterized protein n=2 Tax=Pseudozyma flocculosa TaxID=84751 RepID=A0A5C3F3I0_9BASI|nr:uncharacterized protein PFL1_05801 [Pseudozyma flocculosa PF-1]EPQ26479.1 hypothetical protein PFL1_05801 [Pseudozyma flocculosa PF-1]SPO38535.1 uncharacterized protein PSFLO_04013 [Pseudozyma flocculosa]